MREGQGDCIWMFSGLRPLVGGLNPAAVRRFAPSARLRGQYKRPPLAPAQVGAGPWA